MHTPHHVRLVAVAAMAAALALPTTAGATSVTHAPSAPTQGLPLARATSTAASPARATVFSRSYVTCITGIGVPVGVAVALWPYTWAMAVAVRRGSPPGSAVPRALWWVAQSYGRRVVSSCRAYLAS